MSDCSTHAFDVPLRECPFCGGEAYTVNDGGRYWTVECHDCAAHTGLYATKDFAIAAWNSREERGTLTAEQVREAIMSVDRWKKPMGNTGLMNTHLIIRDDGWQAIADELNSRAERTCKMRADGAHCMNGVEFYECRSCGEYACIPTVMGKSEPPNYCPNCGARVVS